MPTIMILGGYGYTGKFLAKHLLAQTDAKIIISGRNMEKANAFAEELNNERVTTRQVDATNYNSLTGALQGVNMCLVAAPVTHHAENVVRSCLDERVDYLDVQFSSKKLDALRRSEAEIKHAHLCFVTEAGYHPGLIAALIRYSATKLDTLESALTAGYLNMKDIPYSEAVDELTEAFLDYQAQIFKNGAWTKPSSWDMREFYFGSDIGKRTCYSMFFEELRDIPNMFPHLQQTGFYISGANPLADMVITPLVFLGLKIAPKRGLRPLGKLMWWAMGKSKPPYLVALTAEAKGQLAGKQAQVRVRVAHPDGYELTAIPVVAYLRQYLDGSAKKSGVHMLGHIADPVQLFADMQRMGAIITESLDHSST
ncbi:MAG TPA: saccharopine dehydrogenase NADP-binding domain-containing protein [Anaerolineales bacterium]|nr:saccharopine dehydrogenase NADP-binding domain-containing protein [Anaerolineales bacterium]HNA88747.1 saccharopine dehydrogenase NADP-binding domain-containing protein [Anaerolineales bacterium]HNB34958.1 saccharopine dehydrogenase NADP-binding domain-containing protein [Anaerolineales bacterium]